MVEVVEAESGLYRNVHPQALEVLIRQRQQAAWDRQQASLGACSV